MKSPLDFFCTASCACALVFASAGAQQPSPPSGAPAGSIDGIVTAYDGKPAQSFQVEAVGASPTSTYRASAKTDKDGKFVLSGLNYGEYVVDAYLDGDENRYPGGFSSFYEPRPLRLEVKSARLEKPLRIDLGPPSRILTGTVSSLSDGSKITAIIQIEFPHDPDRFIRFSSARDGSFRALIPSNTRLILKSSAPGFDEASQPIGPFPMDRDPSVEVKLSPKAIPWAQLAAGEAIP